MKTFTRIWLGIGLMAIVFGLGMLLLAFVTSADKDIYTPVYSIDKTFKDIDQLHMDISYGKVEIIEGDKFHIHGENILDDEFETYVNEGVWYIKDDYKNWFSFFDIGMTLKGNLRRKDIVPKITITLPKGFYAENITLKLRAGEVKADIINARKGTFSMDAGTMEIGHLQVLESSSYHVGAGQMTVKEIVANDITIKCGVGEVVIGGTITGKSKVENNVGSVKLSLLGEKEDYSYDIISNIGNITIDGESIGGLGKQRRIDNENTGNSLAIECDIGDITIDFVE